MTQDDLATDDVMILDTWEQVKNKLTAFAVLYAFRAESVPTKRINSTINLYLFGFFFYSQVFVWIGNEAQEEEKTEAMASGEQI